MAGYYITYSNQGVTGTAANDVFELATNASLTGVVIDAGGGNDTIKTTDTEYDSNGKHLFQATVYNLDPGSTLDFSGITNYSGAYYYVSTGNGFVVTDSNARRINLTLAGMTDTSIFSRGSSSFISRNIYSTKENETLYGTDLSDYFLINHQGCTANYSSGDDTIIAYTDNDILMGGFGNDLVIAHGSNSTLGANSSAYFVNDGDDMLISEGANNYLADIYGNNLFIVGGNNSTAIGGRDADTFGVYSYSGGATSVTLTGGGNNDSYIISTGLAGADGAAVGAAVYNPYVADTVNVAITDFDAFDTIYLRDFGLTAINHGVTNEGILLADDTGRVNILLAGQLNWDAVKNALITYDDAQGNVGVTTLEQAALLPIAKVPAGIYINGSYLNVTANFTGNLLMSGAANFTNGAIVTIDATSNPQSGMFLGGNENPNLIYAGYGGNVLWGGTGVTTPDYLFGGAGADIFMAGKYDGNDVAFNTDANDVISLYDTNLSDITSFYGDGNSIALGFNTGNVIAVATSDVLSPAFQLASGQSYRFNRATASWQQA